MRERPPLTARNGGEPQTLPPLCRGMDGAKHTTTAREES